MNMADEFQQSLSGVGGDEGSDVTELAESSLDNIDSRLARRFTTALENAEDTVSVVAATVIDPSSTRHSKICGSEDRGLKSATPSTVA